MRKHLSLLLIWLLALALRLPGLIEAPLQPDENHWLSRGSGVVERMKSAPTEVTGHLGHPGLPAAFIIGAAQVIGHRVGPHLPASWRVDDYTVARLANCLVSSLLIPALYLVALPWVGWGTAALSSIFLALDPVHIDASRVVHIDGVLALLVTLSVALYFKAVLNGRLFSRLSSGIGWGLCMVTKPTALVLPVVFAGWKLVLRIFGLSESRRLEGPIVWQDFWALLAGQFTMILLHTRFWYHMGEFRVHLLIKTRLAKLLYRAGMILQIKWGIAVALIAGLVLVWAYLRRKKWSGLSQLTLAVIIFSLVLVIWPQIWENVARYWTWVLGLSGTKHNAFGKIVNPPPYGYFGLLLSSLPLGGLFGLVPGLWFVWKLSTGTEDRRRAQFLLLHLVLACLWCLPLSISPKQAWRYALPMLPSLYLLAAFGWHELLNFIRVKFGAKAGAAAWIGGGLAILMLQAYPTLSSWQQFETSSNDLFWSEAQMIQFGASRPRVGRREVIEYLLDAQAREHEPQFVTVIGDGEIMINTLRRWYPGTQQNVKFGYFSQSESNYLLLMWFMRDTAGAWGDLIDRGTPVVSIGFAGQPVISLYPVPFLKLNSPLHLPVTDQAPPTGRITKDETGNFILARAGSDQTGFVFGPPFGLRLSRGKYKLEATLTLQNGQIALDPKAKIVRLDLGNNCHQLIYGQDLIAGQNQTFSLECELDSDQRTYPRVFWTGQGNIELRQVSLMSDPD